MDTITKPLNKRDLAKRATQARAIEAARRLWAEPGSYNENGIREIAKAMGNSTGAVFASFTDKADLWWSAFGCAPPVDSVDTRNGLAAIYGTYPGESL